MIRQLFNLVARRRPYRAAWVEDLPGRPAADMLYVIGGRRHPFQVAVVCPRRACRQIIHLDISPTVTPRWSLVEHADGSVSISPSVHVTGLPCRCHYWVRRGRIQWSEAPRLGVPKENRYDTTDRY